MCRGACEPPHTALRARIDVDLEPEVHVAARAGSLPKACPVDSMMHLKMNNSDPLPRRSFFLILPAARAKPSRLSHADAEAPPQGSNPDVGGGRFATREDPWRPMSGLPACQQLDRVRVRFGEMPGSLQRVEIWIAIGLISGWLASAVDGGEYRIIGHIGIGIAGSFLGGLIFRALLHSPIAGPARTMFVGLHRCDRAGAADPFGRRSVPVLTIAAGLFER